jgi:NTE family protein
MSAIVRKPIALALSGGGIRAMVFHMGVLKALAERKLLEQIGRISTVSGGSLLIGLMLQESGLKWPSSQKYLASIYLSLRTKLCERSLQWGAARQLKNPSNLRFLLSRANLLALALKNEWGVDGNLSDLPSMPEWSINGTTAENGKRFRFKSVDFGDYTLGYADAGNFPLADALAVSAAFPGGFGPLTLDARQFTWRKRPWAAPAGTEQPVDIGYAKLHLYDGGVYDNLGLEPFFDAGRSKPKHDGIYIIVSDAGAPLSAGFDHGSFSLYRLKRVADIMSDQARALRVRTFATYLQQAQDRGAYIYIDTPVTALSRCQSAAYAARFPTTLRCLDTAEFDKLAEHGYRVAKKVERDYGLYTMPSLIKDAV